MPADAFVRGTVMLSSELNAAVVDCIVASVDVFVRSTVVLSSELDASVVNWFGVPEVVCAGGDVPVHLPHFFC